MRRVKLTRKEKEIEAAAAKKGYVPVISKDYKEIALALAARRKDTVLNIRVNSQDLKRIKQKAKKLGVKYQTFIAELLHQVADA